MLNPDILHRDFTAEPFWWEAYRPVAGELTELPREVRVAIVGGGYAGLATALELARHGIAAAVLEAQAPGAGASTRNGGAVSGGVNIGKSFSGKSVTIDGARAARLLADAADAFALVDRLIREEQIECFWETKGRFVAAWTSAHFEAQRRRLSLLNAAAQSGAYMVPREQQREEIASDYYHGGMVVERSGKLHPALYYKGLLDACRRREVPVCANAAVRQITPAAPGWRLETSRGTVVAGDVVIATNGYTGDLTPSLERRIVPIASHIIATEELPSELARSLIPKGRTLSDTRRTLCYYRMSPACRRGQRARSLPLHDRPLSAAARGEGDPRLDRQYRLHPRRSAAYGREQRAPFLSGLQWQRGGDDDLSRLADGAQNCRDGQRRLQFRHAGFSRSSALFGQSVVSAGGRRLVPAARPHGTSFCLRLRCATRRVWPFLRGGEHAIRDVSEIAGRGRATGGVEPRGPGIVVGSQGRLAPRA